MAGNPGPAGTSGSRLEDLTVGAVVHRLSSGEAVTVVATKSVGSGAATLSWQTEGFATADALDESTGRYLGLSVGGLTSPTASTLVVSPTLAVAQLDADCAAREGKLPAAPDGPPPGGPHEVPGGRVAPTPAESTKPTRFHAAVDLDPERLNRDFGKVSAEVIAHLTSLLGTDVTITVEIAATNPAGFPDLTVRSVNENAKTLKFTDHGFEDN